MPEKETQSEPEPMTAEMTGDVEGTVNVQVTPVFTPEQMTQDRKNRSARTAEQAFPAAFVVTIFAWVFLLNGIDLDPGEGTGLPPGIEAAWTGLLTWLGAKWMNREPKDESGHLNWQTALLSAAISVIVWLIMWELIVK